MFLPEAIAMKEWCDERPGQTMAAIDFMDSHPEYRLVLESLIERQGGALFEEVPDYTSGASLPFHLRCERAYYLRRTGGEFNLVQNLLQAIGLVYGDGGATTTAGLKEARRWFESKAKSLDGDYVTAAFSMTEYFRQLASSLPELTDEEFDVMNLGSAEVFSQTGLDGVESIGFAMYENPADKPLPEGCGVSTRFACVHSPGADIKRDWVLRQPKTFRIPFFCIRKASKLAELKKWCAILRQHGEKKTLNSKQLTVLWDVYKSKRDYLRKQTLALGERSLGDLAKKLIESLERIDDPKLIGRAGACFYNWSKGHKFNGKPCPGKLNAREWAVIWDRYRTHKEHLIAAEQELKQMVEELF